MSKNRKIINLVSCIKSDYIDSFIKNVKTISGFDIKVSNDSFLDKMIPQYEIIHIHWPESLFKKWKIRRGKTFKRYLNALYYYKDRNPILLTLHNLQPHAGLKSAGQEIYRQTIQHADTIHHLGPFSKHDLKEMYKVNVGSRQVVIPHHILPKAGKVKEKNEARLNLGLSKAKKIAFAIGSLRNIKDASLIFEDFNELKSIEEYSLIVHKYRNLINRNGITNLIKHPVNVFKEFQYRFLSQNIHFINKHMDLAKLEQYIVASDVIILERTENCNSGVPFLLCNYQKPIVSQATKNISWSMKQLGYRRSNDLKNGYLLEHPVNKDDYNREVFGKMIELYKKIQEKKIFQL